VTAFLGHGDKLTSHRTIIVDAVQAVLPAILHVLKSYKHARQPALSIISTDELRDQQNATTVHSAAKHERLQDN